MQIVEKSAQLVRAVRSRVPIVPRARGRTDCRSWERRSRFRVPNRRCARWAGIGPLPFGGAPSHRASADRPRDRANGRATIDRTSELAATALDGAATHAVPRSRGARQGTLRRRFRAVRRPQIGVAELAEVRAVRFFSADRTNDHRDFLAGSIRRARRDRPHQSITSVVACAASCDASPYDDEQTLTEGESPHETLFAP